MILGILMTAFFVSARGARAKARDAHRKADLERIKGAFESYYNDYGCYPDPGSINTCGSTDLDPYLKQIPCDPLNGQPYIYVPLADQCDGYRLHALLENESDPIIASLGCSGETGCGYDGEYVYGISQGAEVFDPEGDGNYFTGGLPSPSPSGTPTYVYACDSSGVCNQFEEGHPVLNSCPTTFPTPSQCETGCIDPDNWCGF